MNNMNKLKIIEFNQDYLIDNSEQEDNDYLYYQCLAIEEICLLIQKDIILQYNSLSSLLFSHNINKKFNIPMIDNIAIMNDPVFYEYYSYSIFSFNLPKLLKKLKEIFGNENDILILNYYLDIKMNDFFNELNANIDLILVNPHPLIELFFNKTINKIKKEMPDYLELYKNNIFHYGTQKEVDILYEKIIKGKSKIQDCIKDFEFLENKLEINDIFNLNHSYFIFVSKSSINQGILKLG